MVAEVAAADDSQKGGTGDQSKNIVSKKETVNKTIAKRNAGPNTGDDKHTAIWLIILVAAVCGLVGYSVKQKRNQKTD